MTPEERSAPENGIWLCDVCGRAVDSKDSKFKVEELHRWKRCTDEDSWRSVMELVPYGPGMSPPTASELRDRLRAGALSDLAVFRNTEKWPSTTVSLTLKIDQIEEPLSTKVLARAVTTFDDLILVASPGMGKTTTIFQIAEGILESENGIPFIVPLGDWATDNEALLASIMKRPAVASLSEADFRAVADEAGVVLLLDGWNELDGGARERARVQIKTLKAQLPDLGLVISTRKQALDIPFRGARIDVLPLGDEQQLAIARAMRGEAGERLLDQAWRTVGVRELVTIPLYLTTLLLLPDGALFPTTKEEVLRLFVTAHEQDPRRAEALRAAFGGLQHYFLSGLAEFATARANTAIGDVNARKSMIGTARMLESESQLVGIPLQADALLDTLVSNHVLMRSGDAPGYAFQHQQFQEWYASHRVEELMLQADNLTAEREKLKWNVFNHRPWTESILFAVERTARGNSEQKAACSVAILIAFEVDPILAAEMIYRSTDDVWMPISIEVITRVKQWHAPRKLDRAVNFMITSGRPEFGDLLWPLLAHENDQVQLSALRAAGRFRPSVLGSKAADRIAALPPEIRRNILHEIAANSAMDGLDLATAIAKKDDDPEEKAIVAGALWFRRAERHVVALLSDADDKTYDILAKDGHLDDISDETVQNGLVDARKRRGATELKPHERLRSLLYGHAGGEAEIANLVATMDIDSTNSAQLHLLAEVRQRYPQALVDSLLVRLREGRELFYGAADILAAAGLSLEDDALLSIALQESKPHDNRADAASSVLAPLAVGKLIDAYLLVGARLRDSDGKYDEAQSNRFHALRRRIRHTQGASLIIAVQSRADDCRDEDIANLAALFSREDYGSDERARPFSEDSLVEIGRLAQKWGERLLTVESANREQKASIATLISHAPSVILLPILRQLLDDNLRRYSSFREIAKASDWCDRGAVTEAQHPHMHEYQRAFTAIRAPESDAIMGEYLTDEHFGESAARILATHWSAANEPKDDRKIGGNVDFSRVKERRAVRATNTAVSSAEADLIFAAIDRLIVDETTEEQKKLACSLGIIGARLPHGERTETIGKLIALAPRQSRAYLLLSLILSGEDIDIGLVADGIAKTFDAAKKEAWILQQNDAYQLRDWLRLLPFATPVSEIPTIVRSLPDAQRNPRMLEEMIRGLGTASTDDAEATLFKLAEDDPHFYLDYQWRSTALRLGTRSSSRRIIDLTVSGTLNGKFQDEWHWRSELASLISKHPETRAYARQLLKDGPITQQLLLLARAVAEMPEADDVVMLVDLEKRTGHSLLGLRSIESAVTTQVPIEHWQGAYNVVPAQAADLRQKLLALTGSGGPDDPAARCLTTIDKLRDQYGAPETEPRHPDLASGRQWPILKPDPDAEYDA